MTTATTLAAPAPGASAAPSAAFAVPGPLGRFAVIAFLLFLRRPDALLNPQFWAEDATVFFKDAFESPGCGTWLRPYNGYAHLLPRMLADLFVRLFPPEAMPAVFNATAILIATACVCLFASPRYSFLVRSDRVRLAACMAVAAGHPALEIIHTLTNVHWYLTLGALLLLVGPPRSRAESAVGAAALLLAGLSCPLALFLLPMALPMLLTRVGGRRAAAAALSAAVLLQAGLMARIAWSAPPEERRALNFEPRRIADNVLDRARVVSLYATYGQPLADYLALHRHTRSGWLVGINTLLLAVLLGAASWVNLRRALIAAGLALIWMTAHALTGDPADPTPGWLFFAAHSSAGTRFLFMPFCVVVFMLALLCDGADRLRPRLLGGACRAVVAASFLAVSVAGARAVAYCDLNWRPYAAEARRNGWHADIPINPPPWTLRLRGAPAGP